MLQFKLGKALEHICWNRGPQNLKVMQTQQAASDFRLRDSKFGLFVTGAEVTLTQVPRGNLMLASSEKFGSSFD